MRSNWIAILALGIATQVYADKVQFSDLPKRAQRTVNNHLSGGVVKSIERTTADGKTIYEVGIRREGRDRQIVVDADGNLLPERKVFNLDGVGNREVRTKVDADKDGLDVELDTHKKEPRVEVEAEVDSDKDNKVFRKGDGKILGVPVPGQREDKPKLETEVELKKRDADLAVSSDVDGRLDTDKEDGRILGLPKRGFDDLKWSQVPEPVKRTVRREARNQKVVEIEVETRDGKSVYEVDIEKDGLNRELKIAADGTILSDSHGEIQTGAPAAAERGVGEGKRDNLALNQLPKPVQQTITRTVGTSKGIEIKEVEREGKRVYEVKVSREGKDRTLLIDASGRILKDSAASK